MAVSYDPKKAHEYYMKHRKLKGRRSQKGFSTSQKERVAYARAQLSEQRNQKNTSDRERIREAKKKQLEQITEQTKAKVDALRERLRNMPKEQRAAMKEQVQGVIDSVRDLARNQKADVRQKASKDSKAATAKNRADYEKALDKAYSKIRKKR